MIGGISPKGAREATKFLLKVAFGVLSIIGGMVLLLEFAGALIGSIVLGVAWIAFAWIQLARSESRRESRG